MSDLDFRVRRGPLCDRDDREAWILEKRRAIFGWSVVGEFLTDRDTPHVDVINYAMSLHHEMQVQA